MDSKKTTQGHLKVAVTGGAGSGKSSVCNRFKELGARVINADDVARKVVRPGSPGIEKIVHCFGKAVLKPDGSLNRQQMRRIMLSDDNARKTLEKLIHPDILEQMNREIRMAEQVDPPLIIVEVPLLFELDLAHGFDCVVMVSAAPDMKIRRLMSRDQVTQTDARQLLHTQLPDELKERESDYIIGNNTSLKDLTTAVDNLYQRLLEKLPKSA